MSGNINAIADLACGIDRRAKLLDAMHAQQRAFYHRQPEPRHGRIVTAATRRMVADWPAVRAELQHASGERWKVTREAARAAPSGNVPVAAVRTDPDVYE